MAQQDMMATFTAALFVVAAAVAPLSSAAAVEPSSPAVANDECNKGCSKYEKTEPARFAQCKDECILEADFKAATLGLDECNKACEAKGGSTADEGVCMEACTMQVDAAVGVVATRACYRDCARDNKDAAALKKCEALCDTRGEKGAAAAITGEKEAAAATTTGEKEAAPKPR